MTLCQREEKQVKGGVCSSEEDLKSRPRWLQSLIAPPFSVCCTGESALSQRETTAQQVDFSDFRCAGETLEDQNYYFFVHF